MPDHVPTPRNVFMVLSPRALSYAHLALSSLLAHADESLHLTLITDSADDRTTLEHFLATLHVPAQHTVRVVSEHDLDDTEATRFAALPNLRVLRHGHPCWRKITDPLLLAAPGDEMILLDPDLWFPNRFTFEPTPASGLLLMWQRPNCLYPPETVARAFAAGIPLAHHADIGVAHWRLSPSQYELSWLDDVIARLGGKDLPRLMHIEAVLWSALALHVGGGHLDPTAWHCWHRTQIKRLRIKLGATGSSVLLHEPVQNMKCFHAGGAAKNWLPEFAQTSGYTPRSITAPTPVVPFTEFTRATFGREQRLKQAAAYLGYYKLFGGG